MMPRKYTREDPAPDPKPWRPPRRKPIETETGWTLPPLKRPRGAPPWKIVPNRAWFAATPDAVEVSWIAPVVCTGRGTHSETRLGSVARIVHTDGSRSLELVVPDPHALAHWRDPSLRAPRGSTTSYYFHFNADRGPGEGSQTSGRFLCPRCRLDVQVTETRFLRLAALDAVARIDVSKVLT